jgi:hypothetical protein
MNNLKWFYKTPHNTHFFELLAFVFNILLVLCRFSCTERG